MSIQINLKYHSIERNCQPSARTPLVDGRFSDALLNAAMQNVKQALLQNTGT